VQNRANEIKLKLQAIKDKIAEHDDSLFSENIGKLRTGLSCHHNFNSDKNNGIKSGIERDVDHFIEDLDRVSTRATKYWATHKIGSKSKPTEARKKKEQKKKGNKGRITTSDNRGKSTCVIFRSLGGTPLENDDEPEIYGILQLQWIEEETLSQICSP